MKTSKYPFKVKKTGCSKYSVEFFGKKYVMYKSDAYIKTCWVMEEIPYFSPTAQYKWFGCKKLSDYLDKLKLIYEYDVATLKDLTAKLLESLKLEGGENGPKETK